VWVHCAPRVVAMAALPAIKDTTGIIELQANTFGVSSDDPENEEYVPSKRVILAPVMLTPDMLVKERVETGMELIEMSFGCAKRLQELQYHSEGHEDWDKVTDGLKHIAVEGSMFMAKRKLGDLGACEVIVGCMKFLSGGQGATKINEFGARHISALSWGCKAMATLADTELANKMRFARAGAIAVAVDLLKARNIHQNHDLVGFALQVLLNLPNKVFSERWNNADHPFVREWGHEDNLTKMLDAGANEVVCDLMGWILHNIEELQVPHHGADALLATEGTYLASAPKMYQFLDMCCRMLQALGNHAKNRELIFAAGARELLLNSLHVSMPILPVPSGADMPPLEFSEPPSPNGKLNATRYHDPDYDDEDAVDPVVEAAEREAKKQEWLAGVAHLERKGELVRKVNDFRYATQKTVLYSIIVLATDAPSREAICDGHNDHTNAVKVILKVMLSAFHDHECLVYRHAKMRESEEFAKFQQTNSWTTTDQQIFKAVKRNANMAAHSKKSIPSLFETLKQRTLGAGSNPARQKKGHILRGPPKSPTRTGVLNLYKASDSIPSSSFGRSMSMSGSLNEDSVHSLSGTSMITEKLKSPAGLVVAEHACWALNILTVESCVGNRLELLECGETVLHAIANSVRDIEENEAEAEEELELALETLDVSSTKTDALTLTNSTSTSATPLQAASPIMAEALGMTSKANRTNNVAEELTVSTDLLTIAESRSKDTATKTSASVSAAAKSVPVEPCIIPLNILSQLQDHEIPFYGRLHKLIRNVSAALKPTEAGATFLTDN